MVRAIGQLLGRLCGSTIYPGTPQLLLKVIAKILWCFLLGEGIKCQSIPSSPLDYVTYSMTLGAVLRCKVIWCQAIFDMVYKIHFKFKFQVVSLSQNKQNIVMVHI